MLAATPGAEGEDAALALWALHELHYRGFDDVDDALEWDPQLVRVRSVLERDLEVRLRTRFTRPEGLSFVEDFFGWLDQQEGASLARHVHRDATYDQAVELLRVKSLYHLKESDPVAWLVPRLGVRAKAALDEKAREQLTAAEDRYKWDTRFFAERQESLPLACEIPLQIEQRAFDLAREIRALMKD